MVFPFAIEEMEAEKEESDDDEEMEDDGADVSASERMLDWLKRHKLFGT